MEGQKKEEVVLGEDGKPISKKAQKKLEKQQEKDKKKVELEKLQKQKEEEAKNDPSKELYGDRPFVQPKEQPKKRHFTFVEDLDETKVNQQVLIRARIHNIRGKGKMAFIILRESYYNVQCVISKSETVSNFMMKFIQDIPRESLVELEGKVLKPEKAIESCTQPVEVEVQKIYVISRAVPVLPFQLDDACRKLEENELEEAESDEESKQSQPEEEKKEKDKTKVVVKMKTRLDNRIIDLRTKSKQAIFKLSAGICQLFRDYLTQQKFTEIHTPKLIGGSSEGGANVFKFKYFGKDACLAQSPQLYKQMCVMSDFQRVFEIGPVFRAEKARTHRHLSEFTGLDMEMSIYDSYLELMDFLGEMFCYIFEGIQKNHGKELAIIKESFPAQDFVWKSPVLKFTFEEVCAMLKEKGIEQSVHEDFSTEVEKKAGDIIKEKFGSDFYFIHRYPISARPFYTMLCPDDPNFTCSYDFFMRGEEITSGAQRIHDPVLIEQRAVACGIDPNTIRDYINCFKLGAYPHGGCGIGLERVVMLFCELKNIRNSSLFPRDMNRITP